MSAIGTSWGWGTRMTYLIFIAQRIGEESCTVAFTLHLLHDLSVVGVSYFCVCYYNSSRSDITVHCGCPCAAEGTEECAV